MSAEASVNRQGNVYVIPVPAKSSTRLQLLKQREPIPDLGHPTIVSICDMITDEPPE